MARIGRGRIRQGLALLVGIGTGFLGTKSWRGPEAVLVENVPAAVAFRKPELPALGESPSATQPEAAPEAGYEAYLNRHAFSKEALVAIALLSGELDYLIEAARRFPDDPQVQLLVIGEPRFPGDRSDWYRRFREAQPDNLLASLLLGSQHFRTGETAQALDALRAGASQTVYRDFRTQNSLAMESALIELGEDPLEAKLQSSSQSPLGLTVQIQEAVVSLRQMIETEEEASAQEALTMLGTAIGNQLSLGAANGSSVNRLFGLSIERGFLETLDPEQESAYLPNTPAEALEEIRNEWDQIGEDNDFALDHFEQLNEAQKLHFLDRQRTLGDGNANGWLRSQFPPE